MTVAEFEKRATSIESVYKADVFDMLQKVFGLSQSDIIARRDMELGERSEEMISRLRKGEPSAYIVGRVTFNGIDIKVDPRVLIPRMETEELVMDLCQRFDFSNRKILDLCCGSGCIGLSVAKRFPLSDVTMSDISDDALALAEENRKENDVSNVRLIKSDFLEDIEDTFDFIISNPPYA